MTTMKTKLTLFSAGALVIAGALVYSLGIYPPASKRDTVGAIGQRDVYRDPQTHDAAVTPGSAPVVASTLSADALKVTDALKSADALKVVDALKSADALKVADALKSADALKVVDALKSADA